MSIFPSFELEFAFENMLTKLRIFTFQDSEPEERPRSKKEVKLDDSALGTVQISVTAATPMVEDAEKSFLNDIIKEEEDEDDSDENNAEQLKRDTQLEKEVADAVDEILEEARIETSKRPPPKKTKTLDKSDSKDDSNQAPVKNEPVKVSSDLPSGGMVKVEKPVRSGPPAVPPPPPPVQTAASIDDDNKFEANFEANFDDAFGESDPEPSPPPNRPELPKQLGGRASIPDELAPHQLERLQNLKESNA